MTTITVAARHIAAGVRDNCERCPVALAIMEAFPDACCVAVGTNTFTIETPDDSKTDVDLTEAVQGFIWDFDDGVPVEPFTFTVDYPAVTS